jgi:hypothetical protein
MPSLSGSGSASPDGSPSRFTVPWRRAVTATVGPAPGRRRGPNRRTAVAVAYLTIVMAAAILVLPSALRPPPEPATESGAISPDAPPDDATDQLIQATQQAAGGGAGAANPGGSGAGADRAAAPPPPAPTSTAPALRASGRQCYGHPPRQIESVYSAPCVPGFSGSNGGATGKNVFPNEVRLSFDEVVGQPPDGRVPDTATVDERPETRTFRVLMAYMNQRYETYGRTVVAYGLPTHGDAPTGVDASVKADETYHVFASSDLNGAYCDDQIRRGLTVFCEPNVRAKYAANRPGFYSVEWQDEDLMAYGAEYVCKRLRGKDAAYGGGDVNGRPRRFGVLSDHTAIYGVPAEEFRAAFARECGGEVVAAYDLGDDYVQTGPTAIAAMRQQEVTTIIANTRLFSMLTVMNAADGLSYTPEWVTFGKGGLTENDVATAFPRNQSRHLFGLAGREMPQVLAETECVRAYHSVDPDNDPYGPTCTWFWFTLVQLMNGIQMAGPRLSRPGFEKAMLEQGHRYDLAPWAIGGGFGPGDFGYVDAMGEVWFDVAATDPGTGTPGAFRWTHRGARAKRGTWDADTTELFVRGDAVFRP